MTEYSSVHPGVRFSRFAFRFAGLAGLVEIAPLYFAESALDRSQPPALTHPEFYYGFIGVVIAWQIGYLIMSTDPLRFQPLFPAVFLEKLLYPAALAVLYADGRVQAPVTLAGGAVDVGLLALFIVAWTKLSRVPADPWAIASASRWW